MVGTRRTLPMGSLDGESGAAGAVGVRSSRRCDQVGSEPMEPVQVGVVGCGVIGQHHLEAAHSAGGIAIAAVADRVPDLAAEAAAGYHARALYREGHELIADPNVEAVVLALPAGARADLGVAALQAGKHLLIEKPPGRTATEVEAMLAVQGDLTAACCCSRYRFHESAAVAARCLSTGTLGELREVFVRTHRPAATAPTEPPPAWRLSHALNGDGIAVNWSSYDLDFLLGITGWQLRPRTTLARTWPVAPHLSARVAPGSDAESHFVALILCDDGVALHLERSEFAALESEQAWQVIGSRGSLRLHMLAGGQKRVLLDRASNANGVATEVIWQGEHDGSETHRGPLVDLCVAIRTGAEPKTSLGNALLIQQIFDSIYASARTGPLQPSAYRHAPMQECGTGEDVRWRRWRV